MLNTNRKKTELKFKKVIYLLFLFSGFISFAQGYPDVPISETDETQKFNIYGTTIGDDVGESVKNLGDINGDGIADIIVGAPGVDNGTVTDAGEAYVIFGATGITTSSINIGTLDGSNGFVVRGIDASDKIGIAVSSAGDINNDGINDILIGGAGKVIIIFGSTSGFLSLYTTADINGINGVILSYSNSYFGQTLSNTSDINNDGIDDIIIGEPSSLGNAYVFYGSSSITNMDATVLNGSNGFKVEGFSQTSSGYGLNISNAGDINHDGIQDIVMGFPGYDEGLDNTTGRVVIIFGSSTGFSAVFSLSTLNGTNGFIITDTGDYTRFGINVADGKDFNNDGIDDVAITSNYNAYVVYGKTASFPSSIKIADISTTDKFVFNAGWYQDSYTFSAIDGLSDINNDGVTDLIIASPHFYGYARSGSVYIIYGSTSLPETMESLEINGTNGYHIFDDVRYSYNGFGQSVSNAGDFNNDGTNDFIVGERISNSTTYRRNGATHVFFGNTIDVIDTEAPTISCPSGTQELYANASLPNYINSLASISDNSSYNTDMVYTQTPSAGTLFTATTNVEITVTDRAGNTNSCSFTVNLKTTTEQIDCTTSNFSVNNLNGTNGLTLYGEKSNIETGHDVNSAGDVNGDGINDFIVLAQGDVVNHTGPYSGYHIDVPGTAYIIFGIDTGFPPNINLGSLNGINGFKISGESLAHSRTSSDYLFNKADTAGDINNDGFSDIILSTPSQANRAGQVYIVFGKSGGFSSSFDLTTLDGTNGFTIIGTDTNGYLGSDIDNLGDVNGDNIDDIIFSNSISSTYTTKGKCFVIYGANGTFPAIFDLSSINGTNGFLITSNGVTDGKIGINVAGLGDINGDAINDIAIGGTKDQKFIIFGKPSSSSFPSTFNVEDIDGTNGFAVEHSVETISQYVDNANDINNDGYNDIIFGKKYILFGNTSFAAVVDLETLDGTNGFSFVSSGRVVNSAGDFNNDGYDDILYADYSSQHIIYGRPNWEDSVATTDDYKITISLIKSYDLVSGSYAGDVNNDGIDDIVLGHYNPYEYDYDVNSNSGFAYVIFGQDIPDLQNPEITNCVSNQILDTGDNLPDYTSYVDATDDCDTNLEITQTPEAGTLFTTDTTVTITVTDNAGKEDQCSFQVTTKPFITTWQTTTANETITIPTTGSGYDYTIDWGDGTTETNQTGDATHTFATAGTQTISISGDFPRIYFNNTGDKDKILTIEQWGDIAWTSMERSFYGCTNLNITNTTIDSPDLSLVTNMSYMFRGAISFNQDLSSWDVSNVTDMNRMFSDATSFNQLLDWADTSNVTNMSLMFYGATAFNQDLSSWDVSEVTDMSNMFHLATAFNQDLSSWDVSEVTSMYRMFRDATSFNQPLNWTNTSNVTNMSEMFYRATSFNQPLNWTSTSHVTDMNNMFSRATSFNQDLSSWDVSKVTNMAVMFGGATSFNQDLSSWDVSKVTNMSHMFRDATSFNQPLNWTNTSSVTDMPFMFSGATSFNQDLSSWDVSKVTNMFYMFYSATSFDQDLSSWDVSNVTTMNNMFHNVILSVANYDALLKGWSAQTLQTGVRFSGGNSQYCTAETERQSIIDDFGWTITDAGKVASSTITPITAVNEEDNYKLPAITGANLSGNEKYYTATGGTGTEYSAGDVLTYDASTTYPITLYAYDSGSVCGESEESFTVTLTSSAITFRPFITTWETTTANESITIPTTGAGYDYTIDWGDGTIEINQTGDATHTYVTAGTQTISISGDFPRIYFNNTATDKDKMLTIEQWGDIAWTSMEKAFYGCGNLNITNTTIDSPDLSLVTDMSYMFNSATIFNQDLSSWDASMVRDMSSMFRGATSFNQDLSSWNVSSVTNMFSMFYGATAFNQPLIWTNSSNVTNMSFMFYGATLFNQNLSSWDVSSVTNMSYMFYEATSFNELLDWADTSNVTNMHAMFRGATLFNQPLNWTNTSNVTDMSSMFWGATAFNQPLNWTNTSNVTDMSYMFREASSFNQDLSSWDVSSVTNMSYMFFVATAFNQDLSSWVVSNVTDMNRMFAGATLFNQDISSWDVSKVTYMPYMFFGATSFDQDLGDWSVENVTSMTGIFNGVTLSVANYDALLKGWSTQTLQSGVTFSGGNSKYCTAETERQSMIDNFGWTITDAGKVASPIITTITAVNEEDNYMLPAITGTDLSGNEKYYTATGGTGTEYSAGDILTYDASATYPITLYAYDSGSGCGASEESFTVTLTSTVTTTFRSFITTWETTTANESITIPTTGTGYDYTIDWGDGTIETNQTGDATHVYTTAGTQTISISGDFPRIYFNNTATDKDKILTIEQWGDIAWTSMARAFYGCTNLNITNTTIDLPDLSLVTDMSSIFRGATTFDGNITNWDVSKVTNMHFMFYFASSFNQPLNWDVSEVTNMNSMFSGASSFNQSLNWDVSNVTNIEYMFSDATAFNGDISNWDVSNVTSMVHLFNKATAFDGTITDWDVSNVISMDFMFSDATAFNQPLDWTDTSNVTDMSYMFWKATSFNQDISDWNVSSVTSMYVMFAEATSFNQDLSSWNVSSVTSMSSMFKGATSFNQDLSSWDVSKVSFMNNMFEEATAFNQPLNWTNTSNVTIMYSMFERATSFNQDLSSWDVSKVTSMPSMFEGAISFNQDLSSWNVSSVTDMSSMFYNATSFNQPLNWTNTSNVTDINRMFFGATLFNQDISNWDVSNVDDMSLMFYEATSFDQDLGDWSVENVTNMSFMFTDVTLSVANYDAILKGWSARTLQTGVTFSGGNSKYCTAETERQSIIDDFGWTITDAGKVDSPIITTITAVNEEDNYKLLAITGTDLSGNEKYYTATGGTGTEYSAGDVLTYDASATYPITLYAYDSGSGCGVSEESFTVTLTSSATTFRPFITTWETTTANESITIPTTGTGYDYTIDWGDGTTETNQTGNATHTYTTAGTQTISISGDFPRIHFHITSSTAGNANKIQTIEQWGDIEWTSMDGAFSGCGNLNIINTSIDTPNLSNVTSTSNMFYNAYSFNGDINNWDVSNIINMSYMFRSASSFNQPLNWDVSKVTNMNSMFYGASMFNQPLDWNVSNVTNMRAMFLTANSFNQNISNWDVSKVVTMNNMFYSADSFNQPLDWADTSSVTDMSEMFYLTSSFDQNIGNWNVENVTDMSDMFNGVTLSVANYDALLKGWSTQTLQSGVTFSGGNSKYCTAETERQSMIDNFGWTITDAGKVASPIIITITAVNEEDNYMLPAITGTDLSGNEKYYTTTGGTGTEYAAGDILTYNATTTYPITLYAYDSGSGCGASEESFTVTLTSSATTFRPFITTWETTTANESITIPTTGTGYDYTIDWGDGTTETNQTGDAAHTYTTAGTQTISISGDFPQIYFNNSGDKDKILTIEQWGDIVWTSMEAAFYGCTNLNITNPTIDSPDLSLVGDMRDMFRGATSFNQDLSSWNVSNVTDMSSMFNSATSFNQDLSSWDVSNVTSMGFMFTEATSFNQPLNWTNTSNVTIMSFMFWKATSFNQDLSSWSVSNVTNMGGMFSEATSFNQDLSSWDVSNVIFMTGMFYQATSFNQDLSSLDVSNVTYMEAMFSGATTFDQDLGDWSVENVTNMSFMFTDVTLSVANYDALLKGWSTQTLQSGVTFSGGNSKYCTAETERQSIIDNFGWTITDAGKVASPTITAITAINEIDNYTLPAITGTDLSGNEKYYTATGGTGTEYSAGDVLTYDATTTYPITLYAYDSGSGCGESEESFTVTLTSSAISDTENPTASNPLPISVECASNVPLADPLVVTDEADNITLNPTVDFVSDVSDGNTNPEVITRTYSVTDDAGNSINVTQAITVNDTTNPTASNLSAITVDCVSDIPTADITLITDAMDNCTANPTIAFVSDISDGNTNPEAITRTYSVTDEAGNSINVTQTITVNDITNPTASNLSTITVDCVSDIPTADITLITDAADNCTANPTVAFVSDVSDGNTNPETITRTYSVTDEAGNSINVTQTITVNDITNPTASNLSTITVDCVSDIPTADITLITDAADNCTANPTVAFVSDVSDGNTNPETITRTYSVTDEAGNSINVTQTITVNDITNPTASNLAPITVDCVSDIPTADITLITDATDNCTANPTIAFVSDVSDGNTNPEAITRTYSITDTAGNSINVTQTITVNDITNPTASNLAPITVDCVSDIPTADITLITDAADNCTANPIIAFVSDVNTSIGIITRTYSVTDTAGNSINVTQTITVNDTTNPTASDLTPINVECAGDIPTADITLITDAADNCTANPTIAFVSDVSDGNSNPEIITRTYSITDETGNSINLTQTITVNDTTDPTAINPLSITVNCSAEIPTADSSIVTNKTDNCSANLIVAFVSDVSDGNSNPEIITRTYSVTDEAGNATNVTQTITVNDTIAPQISCPSDIIQSVDTDLSTAIITYTLPVSIDNCSNTTVTQTAGLPSGSEFPIGTTTIAFEVTDIAGNIATCSFDIIIEENPSIDNAEFPNAFTPDNDGVNDVFEITDLEKVYPNFELKIFDRNGITLFNYKHNGDVNNTPQWWDGTYKNANLPTGTYYFSLNYNDGKTKPKVTWLYLNR